MMKRNFWIGIVISAICLFLVFRGIEWLKVLEALKSANVFLLALTILVHLSTIWLRAERWKYLLAPIKKLSFRQLLPTTMIGFMANNILPVRAGEFIRAYLIGKKEQISKTASFATIILERVFDMSTVLIFLVIVLLSVEFPQTPESPDHETLATFFSPELMQKAGIISALFVGGLLAFLVLLKEFPQHTTSIIERLLTPFPSSLKTKAVHLLDAFRDGLQVLKTGKHLFYLGFWSLMVWLASVLGGWLIFFSFGLKLPFISAMFIFVLIAFAVALPSSPGFIGPFHAAVLAGVMLFQPDLDKSTVAGIAIVYHLMAVVPITLMGLYYLWKEHMSLSDIQHIEEEEQAELAQM